MLVSIMFPVACLVVDAATAGRKLYLIYKGLKHKYYLNKLGKELTNDKSVCIANKITNAQLRENTSDFLYNIFKVAGDIAMCTIVGYLVGCIIKLAAIAGLLIYWSINYYIHHGKEHENYKQKMSEEINKYIKELA